MRERSTGSVTVVYLDRLEVIEKTRRSVADLARGDAVPGSDVDLLMVLSESRFPFLDRSVEYRPRGIPVGVDVFAYTQEEIEKMTRDGNPLLEQALSEGVTLCERNAAAESGSGVSPKGQRVASDG